MEKDFNLKVLNIIAGSKYGGAEIFFERLVKSFEKDKNIKQKVILRSSSIRFSNLKAVIQDIEQIASILIPNLEDILCAYPKWLSGVEGLIQLITIKHLSDNFLINK